MVIDLQVIRQQQARQVEAEEKQEQLYFIQCLFSAVGIFTTMIILYFIGYAFL